MKNISIFEVEKAIKIAKNDKASGLDSIPYEIFRNNTCVHILHRVFNVCYETGKIPRDWGKGIINPIPKSNMLDPRDPLSYRGITLAATMYKLYCSVLNDRLSKWLENNDKLADEQNGFRKGRSTIDHLASLTSIIESRLKKRLPTFAAFIDFQKAYDRIDRSTL